MILAYVRFAKVVIVKDNRRKMASSRFIFFQV